MGKGLTEQDYEDMKNYRPSFPLWAQMVGLIIYTAPVWATMIIIGLIVWMYSILFTPTADRTPLMIFFMGG